MDTQKSVVSAFMGGPLSPRQTPRTANHLPVSGYSLQQ